MPTLRLRPPEGEFSWTVAETTLRGSDPNLPSVARRSAVERRGRISRTERGEIMIQVSPLKPWLLSDLGRQIQGPGVGLPIAICLPEHACEVGSIWEETLIDPWSWVSARGRALHQLIDLLPGEALAHRPRPSAPSVARIESEESYARGWPVRSQVRYRVVREVCLLSGLVLRAVAVGEQDIRFSGFGPSSLERAEVVVELRLLPGARRDEGEG